MGHKWALTYSFHLFISLPYFHSLVFSIFHQLCASIYLPPPSTPPPLPHHQIMASSTTPPASPSTTTSMSNSQTSPDKRKPEDSYYSSVTSFDSNISGNLVRVHALPDDSDSDSEPSRTDNRTPTQRDFIDGTDVDLGLPFMRKGSDRPLRNGSPLNDRPMSLPPSSPTHGEPENNERRLSLYDNIDVYYNAHYEQSMEESLEMIATPTGPDVKQEEVTSMFGPPIPLPDGGHVPIVASGESNESLEHPGPPLPPPQTLQTITVNSFELVSAGNESPKRPRKPSSFSSSIDESKTDSDKDNVTENKKPNALKLTPPSSPKPSMNPDGPNSPTGPISSPISHSTPSGPAKSPTSPGPGEKTPPEVKPKPRTPPAVKPKPKSPRSPVNGVPHFKTTATLV